MNTPEARNLDLGVVAGVRDLDIVVAGKAQLLTTEPPESGGAARCHPRVVHCGEGMEQVAAKNRGGRQSPAGSTAAAPRSIQAGDRRPPWRETAWKEV